MSLRGMNLPRHEAQWPENKACPLHNDTYPSPEEAVARAHRGEHHARCPRCRRWVWERDFYMHRTTDGRIGALIRLQR